MELQRCGRCGEQPTITRDETAMAIEISCGCHSLRWAPSENGDVGEQSMAELQAEAISLWNFEHGEPISVGDEAQSWPRKS